MSIVPSSWEHWLATLVRDLKPLPVQEFSVYGGLFPSVLESMIQSSVNITSIKVSHINITDDLLLTISSSCPNLEKLYLLHSFPWMVISIKGLCEAFFKNKPMEYIWNCLIEKEFHKVELSFPKLKEIELSYGEGSEITFYHLVIVSFYKNVKFVHSSWKTNLIEAAYNGHCEDVIQESIALTGASSLAHVFVSADYLFDLTQSQLRNLLWNLPLLAHLTIGCATSPSRSSSADADLIGSKLCLIAKENIRIKSVSVTVTDREDLTRAIILPFLVSKSLNLTEVTIEAYELQEKIYVSLIRSVIETCKVIKCFKALVWDISNIQFPYPEPDLIVLPERESLKEIWLHGGIEGADAYDIAPNLYLILLNSLVMAAPNLETLSITVCHGFENILVNMTSGVSNLHVHVTDGCESQPSFDHWIKMVANQPNLQNLYLEEVDGKTFWKIKKKFSATCLSIHWGTLDGWPRS